MIHVKKDGRVFCVYYDGARRIWEAFGQGDEALKKAETRDMEIKLQKRKGTFEAPLPRAALTYAELTQKYIDARYVELSTKTEEEILRTLETHIFPVIGNKNIDQITLDD